MVSPLRRVPLANAPKEPKVWAPAFGPSLRLGVPSLRDSSGGIASGLLRCTSSRCVWLRQTALRAHPRMNPSTQPAEGAGTSRALLELTLIVLSGERRKAESRKQKADCFCFDRSHAPRGNAARDAPRPILECLKVVSVLTILPTRFSGCPSEARALACFGRCQYSDRVWKPGYVRKRNRFS